MEGYLIGDKMNIKSVTVPHFPTQEGSCVPYPPQPHREALKMEEEEEEDSQTQKEGLGALPAPAAGSPARCCTEWPDDTPAMRASAHILLHFSTSSPRDPL